MQEYWYQKAFFYGMDIRRFQDSNGDGFGDIQGLISRLDYLAGLGVDALWLLPFLDSPLRDNGYDVRDYFRVDPRVGTLEDFLELVQEAKQRKMRLVMDLVMNHTSDQHPWFQASRRAPFSRFRGYYVWVDKPPADTIGVPIFPGEEDSVWTHDPVAEAYYLHRFYHFQPDLVIANPHVQDEIFNVVDFWLSMGVDGFRFDAAPVMVEAKGLESTRMKDPHKLFQDLHTAIIERHPDAVLLGEANVELNLMDRFFGGGSEMNMLFNFLLGPHVLLALAKETAVPVATYLRDLPVPPESDEWLDFLRNHDELSLEKMPPEQTEAIYETFAPEERMRIYNRGIRRRLAPMLAEGHADQLRERQELAFSLLFTFPGVPLIMYGDEIGMGDDLSLPGRNSVRTPMQWSNTKNAGFSTAEDLIAPAIQDGPFGYPQVNVADQLEDEGSLLNFMKRMIAVWKDCPRLERRSVDVLASVEGDEWILVHRLNPVQGSKNALLLIHNFSNQEATVTIPFGQEGKQEPEVLLGRGELLEAGPEQIRAELPGYGYLWLAI